MHNRAKTSRQSAKSIFGRKLFVCFVSTREILVAIRNVKVLTLRHFCGTLHGFALNWEAK